MSMPIIVNSGTSQENAITNIIESVALQQTGLSHILNAEGEKMQTLIAKGATAADLLKVNESARSLVNRVGELEMMMATKLRYFGGCLCE